MSTWEERMAAKHGGQNAAERRSIFPDWVGGVRPDPRPEPPEGPEYCRECCEWDPYEGIYKVTCGLFTLGRDPGCRFGHAHHDDELWMA